MSSTTGATASPSTDAAHATPPESSTANAKRSKPKRWNQRSSRAPHQGEMKDGAQEGALVVLEQEMKQKEKLVEQVGGSSSSSSANRGATTRHPDRKPRLLPDYSRMDIEAANFFEPIVEGMVLKGKNIVIGDHDDTTTAPAPSPVAAYKVIRKVGRGSFGVVALCQKMNQEETERRDFITDDATCTSASGPVALKIMRPLQKYNQYVNDARIEAENLRMISELEDMTKTEREHYVVRLFETFEFYSESADRDSNNMIKGPLSYLALACEPLDCTLHEFVFEKNRGRGMFLEDIRQYARQLLQTAGYLHDRLGACHTDFKHKNIMLAYPGLEQGALRSESAKNAINAFSPASRIPERPRGQVTTAEKAKQLPRRNDQEGLPDLFLKDGHKDKRSALRTHLYEEIPDIQKWPVQVQRSKAMTSNELKKHPYLRPRATEIRVMDFGNMAYEEEYGHVRPINTRQFRAPEILLDTKKGWNEKSDIWCLACVFLFLYSGRMWFNSHDDVEQMGLMEAALSDDGTTSGTSTAGSLFASAFSSGECRKGNLLAKVQPIEHEVVSGGTSNSLSHTKGKGKGKKGGGKNRPPEVFRLKEDILDVEFRSFLRFLLTLHPDRRPSAAATLEHPFLRTDRKA
ncbi:unnamed protein product [Amoebophrya sp. A25]|nr:unnamed protein product [Amoebophrya sp. A25]|eukprot:GSA25T00014762001.1